MNIWPTAVNCSINLVDKEQIVYAAARARDIRNVTLDKHRLRVSQHAQTQRVQSKTYWESLSDKELLEKDLTTDDPEKLPFLVSELPEDFEDSYVEYAYNFRNSARQELNCVHGHHRHLRGFVMRKGDVRWLVGWMCAESIYGENFSDYTADYDAAVNRRDSLARKREFESLIVPFLKWMEETSKSEAFNHYDSVRSQFKTKMPWVWKQGHTVVEETIGSNKFKELFDERTDLRREFAEQMAAASALFAPLIANSDLSHDVVVRVKTTLQRLIVKVGQTLGTLRQVENLFRPKTLDLIVRWGNEIDNPNKRRYSSDLNSISCRREKDTVRIQISKNFRIPDQRVLNELKGRLDML